MSKFNPNPIFFFILLLTFSIILCSSSSSWSCPHHHNIRNPDHRQFQQKTTEFWEFEQKSNTWVEVKLPYDLLSCINDNCTIVGSINPIQDENKNVGKKKKDCNNGADENSVFLPLRKRISLIRMSETSIWITGESGSIYERFWNGLQWVIAPHQLPVSAGFAVSVFIVNQTILALSEAGILYQMQLGENSQLLWVEFTPTLDQSMRKETDRDILIRLKSGVISNDRERIYFCTKGGWLLELSELEPPRWINHGKPPGADVAAIADAASIRPQVIFTVSSSGDLYEFDRNSKPSWKKHIWSEELGADTTLTPSTGCTLQGISEPHSISLFLLTKGGNLVERRLQQRKWKWIIHGSPKDHHLTSITPVSPEETNAKSFSLFLTTSLGFVFEYHIPKQDRHCSNNQVKENWINHMHPQQAKAAKGITGLQFQVGRIIFPLDDGRIGELHQPGIGGESAGPAQQAHTRRKVSVKYVWSILDAPESEGWNAEYCIEERGPSNCILGIKDELEENAETIRSTSMRRRIGNNNKAHEYYYLSSAVSSGTFKEEYNLNENSVKSNFRFRVMHGGRSLFLVTDSGMTFEYLNTENMWFWLRHEYSTAMKGALGNYNGSLFLVDEHRDLIVRERSGNELAWINCTAMKKGRQIISGPPWDVAPGKTPRVTAQDSLFFVSKSGRLLQLTVALRKFEWKDCRSPSNTKIASIVDNEVFRENIVFSVGRNGRLYQYNKVTELWHVHYQSQHMVLSRLPGTAMRPSSQSLTGSLFMLSRDGKLIEYHWNSLEGWNWVEHGTPTIGVTLVGSTGPCFGGNQLFLIGSDGQVYIRHLDQATWKWGNCGFPYMGNKGEKLRKEEVCIEADLTSTFENIYQENQHDTNNCNPKVASTRPIPFTEDSVIFELRDGRLAEMRRTEDRQHWVWWRTIGTPTSFCNVNYWTTMAS